MKAVNRSSSLCSECGLDYIPTSNNQKYCSAVCKGRNSYEANMLDPEWRLTKLMGMAKNRAKTKSLAFDLDIDHLTYLWEENDGCCALSGVELQLERSEKGKVHPYAPSLDRIVPKLGYTKGNIRITAYQMNVALSEFGLEQFEEFINAYIQNSRSSF